MKINYNQQGMLSNIDFTDEELKNPESIKEIMAGVVESTKAYYSEITNQYSKLQEEMTNRYKANITNSNMSFNNFQGV